MEVFQKPSYNNENNHLQVVFIFNFTEHFLKNLEKPSEVK